VGYFVRVGDEEGKLEEKGMQQIEIFCFFDTKSSSNNKLSIEISRGRVNSIAKELVLCVRE